MAIDIKAIERILNGDARVRSVVEDLIPHFERLLKSSPRESNGYFYHPFELESLSTNCDLGLDTLKEVQRATNLLRDVFQIEYSTKTYYVQRGVGTADQSFEVVTNPKQTFEILHPLLSISGPDEAHWLPETIGDVFLISIIQQWHKDSPDDVTMLPSTSFQPFFPGIFSGLANTLTFYGNVLDFGVPEYSWLADAFSSWNPVEKLLNRFSDQCSSVIGYRWTTSRKPPLNRLYGLVFDKEKLAILLNLNCADLVRSALPGADPTQLGQLFLWLAHAVLADKKINAGFISVPRDEIDFIQSLLDKLELTEMLEIVDDRLILLDGSKAQKVSHSDVAQLLDEMLSLPLSVERSGETTVPEPADLSVSTESTPQSATDQIMAGIEEIREQVKGLKETPTSVHYDGDHIENHGTVINAKDSAVINKETKD